MKKPRLFVYRHVPMILTDDLKAWIKLHHPGAKVTVRGRGSRVAACRKHGARSNRAFDQDLPLSDAERASVYVDLYPHLSYDEGRAYDHIHVRMDFNRVRGFEKPVVRMNTASPYDWREGKRSAA